MPTPTSQLKAQVPSKGSKTARWLKFFFGLCPHIASHILVPCLWTQPQPALSTGTWKRREGLCSEPCRNRVHTVEDCLPPGMVLRPWPTRNLKKLLAVIKRKKKPAQKSLIFTTWITKQSFCVIVGFLLSWFLFLQRSHRVHRKLLRKDIVTHKLLPSTVSVYSSYFKLQESQSVSGVLSRLRYLPHFPMCVSLWAALLCQIWQ